MRAAEAGSEIDTEFFEVVRGDVDEAGLDGDLNCPLLAQLAEQVLQLTVGAGGLSDDQLPAEFADRRDRAAILAPTVGLDGVANQFEQFIDALFAVVLFVLSLVAAGIGERVLPALVAAAEAATAKAAATETATTT